MTNGEHNLWLGNALRALPDIESNLSNIKIQLKAANLINATKNLYDAGLMNEEGFKKAMRMALDMSGYTWSE